MKIKLLRDCGKLVKSKVVFTISMLIYLTAFQSLEWYVNTF